MDFDILVSGLITFKTKYNQECAFIELVKPDHFKCWMNKKANKQINKMQIGLMNVCHISVEELKETKLWDKLDEDIQKSVEECENIVTNDIHKKVRSGQGQGQGQGRRKKYPNMPVEITCITCGDEITINKANVAKKIERLGIGLDQYIKEFECRTCKPVHRGRAKKDYGNVPDRMICKCGHVVKYSQSSIINMAKKKGMTVEEMVNGYECQKCSPTIGISRGKKKKDYGNVPDRMICKCGQEIKYHPSMIIKMAKKKGMTVEEMVNRYECQKCKKCMNNN